MREDRLSLAQRLSPYKTITVQTYLKLAIQALTVAMNLACSSMKGKWPLSSKMTSFESGSAAWMRSAPGIGGVIQS